MCPGAANDEFQVCSKSPIDRWEANSPYRAQTVHPHLSLHLKFPKFANRLSRTPGERWLLKAVPAICPTLRYILRNSAAVARYGALIGQNLPQIVTHILQKAFFKHALGVTGVQRLCIAGIPLVPVNKHRVCAGNSRISEYVYRPKFPPNVSEEVSF